MNQSQLVNHTLDAVEDGVDDSVVEHFCFKNLFSFIRFALDGKDDDEVEDKRHA